MPANKEELEKLIKAIEAMEIQLAAMARLLDSIATTALTMHYNDTANAA